MSTSTVRLHRVLRAAPEKIYTVPGATMTPASRRGNAQA
jgi:hypothetical protein